MTYFINILLAIDQLGCTLVGGYPDETLSSYAHRLRKQGKPAGVFANWIDWAAKAIFNQDDHCLKAYQSERLRVQLPPELRD